MRIKFPYKKIFDCFNVFCTRSSFTAIKSKMLLDQLIVAFKNRMSSFKKQHDKIKKYVEV
jgi:hypothetical protein